MSDSCVFCRIVDGELPSRTVYEDDDVMAFLDANPLAPGHTLVVPKGHYGRLRELSDEESAALFSAVHDLSEPIENAVDADAANVGINDGPAAGQEVPHLHVHVVPRFEGDGGRPIHAVAGERPDLDDDELDDIAAAISRG